MKLRHGLLAACMVIAGWLAVFGDKTPDGGIAEAVARAPAETVAVSRPGASVRTSALADKGVSAPVILALQPRESLIGGTPAAADSVRLFASQNWNPPPPPPQKPPPPQPPSAPPLPFTYLGKKIEEGTWEVYLSRGNQTLIVRENSMIDGAYRIDAIRPPNLSLTYMPLNQTQTLAIGGAE
jgi:hypothetical protein